MTTTTTTLAQDARALKILNQETKAAKDVYDDLKSARDQAERELMERMEIEEVTSINTGGTMYVRAQTPYGQIQDRSVFIAWAEENDEGLLKTVERQELLNALARKHLDDGEPLPPGLGYRLKDYVSQRAAAS